MKKLKLIALYVRLIICLLLDRNFSDIVYFQRGFELSKKIIFREKCRTIKK